MNVFKKLRRPSVSLFLACMVLFFSCSKYDVVNDNSFDYDGFGSFKTLYKTFDFQSYSGKTELSTYEKNTELLEIVNQELETNLVYPDFALEAIDYEAQVILEVSLEENWISQDFAYLTETFMSDIQVSLFDVAIENLEQNTLNLNLDPEEFEKVNLFANTLKSLNFSDPDLFVYTTKDTGWRCALALIALAAATAGLGSCVTVAACALAVTLHVNAMYAVADHCGSKERPEVTDS